MEPGEEAGADEEESCPEKGQEASGDGRASDGVLAVAKDGTVADEPLQHGEGPQHDASMGEELLGAGEARGEGGEVEAGRQGLEGVPSPADRCVPGGGRERDEGKRREEGDGQGAGRGNGTPDAAEHRQAPGEDAEDRACDVVDVVGPGGSVVNHVIIPVARTVIDYGGALGCDGDGRV